MSDTWVALDGRDPTLYFYTDTVWICDCGPYIGPVPPVLGRTGSWVPADARRVDWFIALPNLASDTVHVADGTYTTRTNGQIYTRSGLGVYGTDYTTVDSGAHLFAVWYDPASPSDPADLATPSVSPLDVVPAALVSGGRLVLPLNLAFDFAGLTIAADTVPGTVSGSAAFTFSRLRVTATSDKPSMALYDTDGVTWLANLPDAIGIRWQWVLSAPGSISCKLPIGEATTAMATPGRVLKVSWRGKVRQAARIGDTTIGDAVDGRLWLEFNQIPGVLNMFADALVYPEYGIGRTSSSQRTFGYMSVGGFWTASGNYTVPEKIRWSLMTGVRAGMPEGLDFPDPYWVAKRSPSFYEPVGETQYFRRPFNTYTDSIPYQILATADNDLTLWLDGEQVVTPDMQQGLTWRFLAQVTGNLPAGHHVLAAKVVNGGKTAPSPMGLLVTLQQTLPDGTVVDGPPLINSDGAWVVSDIVPGFQRADVLIRLVNDARGRGVPAFLNFGITFSPDRDSSGIAWTDPAGEHTLDVGQTVLDAAQTLAESAGFDVGIDPDLFNMQAFNRQGTDRFGTVTFALGDTGAVVSHQVDTAAPKFNTALMQLADGTWVERQDAASVSANGRREVGLSMGSTSDPASAGQVASAQFAESAAASSSFQMELVDGRGPRLYTDWFEGDSFGIPDGAGGTVKARAISIDVDASGETIHITPELRVDPT